MFLATIFIPACRMGETYKLDRAGFLIFSFNSKLFRLFRCMVKPWVHCAIKTVSMWSGSDGWRVRALAIKQRVVSSSPAECPFFFSLPFLCSTTRYFLFVFFNMKWWHLRLLAIFQNVQSGFFFCLVCWFVSLEKKKNTDWGWWVLSLTTLTAFLNWMA